MASKYSPPSSPQQSSSSSSRLLRGRNDDDVEDEDYAENVVEEVRRRRRRQSLEKRNSSEVTAKQTSPRCWVKTYYASCAKPNMSQRRSATPNDWLITGWRWLARASGSARFSLCVTDFARDTRIVDPNEVAIGLTGDRLGDATLLDRTNLMSSILQARYHRCRHRCFRQNRVRAPLVM